MQTWIKRRWRLKGRSGRVDHTFSALSISAKVLGRDQPLSFLPLTGSVNTADFDGFLLMQELAWTADHNEESAKDED
jgi:hypothetical protein